MEIVNLRTLNTNIVRNTDRFIDRYKKHIFSFNPISAFLPKENNYYIKDVLQYKYILLEDRYFTREEENTTRIRIILVKDK